MAHRGHPVLRLEFAEFLKVYAGLQYYQYSKIDLYTYLMWIYRCMIHSNYPHLKHLVFPEQQEFLPFDNLFHFPNGYKESKIYDLLIQA